MSLAIDLMGLGMPPTQALRNSNGGAGPLTAVAAGNSFATALRLGGAQYVVSCSNADGTKGLALPPVGGDNGALLADDFVINNAGTTSLVLFASSGVTISVAGSNTSSTKIQSHTTMTLFPISATQWVGVAGA